MKRQKASLLKAAPLSRTTAEAHLAGLGVQAVAEQFVTEQLLSLVMAA